jgi:hypothetical protein
MASLVKSLNNKRFRLRYPLIVLLFVVNSCGLFFPHYEGAFYTTITRGYYIFEEHYNAQDTLIIKDYLFFGKQDSKYNGRLDRLECGTDSIFSIYKNALKNTGLPITFDLNGVNRVNDTTSVFNQFQGLFDVARINKRKVHHVRDLAKDYDDHLVLIPVVHIDLSIPYPSLYRNYAGFYYHLNLCFTAFIFKNQELIYRKDLTYHNEFRGKYQIDKYDACDVHIPIEVINSLVHYVMLDYKKRLR